MEISYLGFIVNVSSFKCMHTIFYSFYSFLLFYFTFISFLVFEYKVQKLYSIESMFFVLVSVFSYWLDIESIPCTVCRYAFIAELNQTMKDYKHWKKLNDLTEWQQKGRNITFNENPVSHENLYMHVQCFKRSGSWLTIF